MSGVLIQNSPYYHIVPHDTENGYFHDMTIFVDVWGQLELSQLFYDYYKSMMSLSIPFPTFPLNTDGVDIWGKNFTFINVNITNFDDAIVPKPSNKGYKISQCTENIYVQNSYVTWSVGMTIGSVPPNKNTACIKDVVFRDVIMEKPLKGIYIKTNPGDEGDGLIQNITYENFVMYHPVWWGIYIGPQQQH